MPSSLLAEIIGLITGRVVESDVSPGKHAIDVPLEGPRARLLRVRPVG